MTCSVFGPRFGIYRFRPKTSLEQQKMSSSLHVVLILVPFTLAVVYMLWVLWNLTMELKPKTRTRDAHRVIPIQTTAYQPAQREQINREMTST